MPFPVDNYYLLSILNIMGNSKGRKKKLPSTKLTEEDREHTATKRKRKINRTIISALLGTEDAPYGLKKEGLIPKSLRILNKHLDHVDPEVQLKAVDRVTKMMPYVLPKDKANPIMNIYNNQKFNKTTNNLVSSDAQSLQDFLAHRAKQRVLEGNIDGQIEQEADEKALVPEPPEGAIEIEFEEEEENGAEETEDQEGSEVSSVGGESSDGDPEGEVAERAGFGEGDDQEGDTEEEEIELEFEDDEEEPENPEEPEEREVQFGEKKYHNGKRAKRRKKQIPVNWEVKRPKDEK